MTWSPPTEPEIDPTVDLILERIAEEVFQTVDEVWDNWREYVAMCNAVGRDGSYDDFRFLIGDHDE